MDIGVIRRDGTRVAAFLVTGRNAEQTTVRAIVKDNEFDGFSNSLTSSDLHLTPEMRLSPTIREKGRDLFNKSPQLDLTTIEVGDLIVAETVFVNIADNVDYKRSDAYPEGVELGRAEVVAKGVDEKSDFASILAPHWIRGRQTQSFLFPRAEEFCMEAYRESLRGQEEAVLVLVMSERNTALLESTGIGVNCMIAEPGYPPDEVMDVSDLEPGVYVARKVHPWASGDGVWEEYDSGIDADLELLTSENLEETLKHFDMDWEGLLNEIDGQIRDDEESISFDVTGIQTPEELNGRLQVFFGKDGKQDMTVRGI